MKISPARKKIMKISVVVGAIIIPLMYSIFYLGAFWDPYSHLDSIPVAIVNQDQGAVINGRERNVGAEICRRLKKDGSLKFDQTTAEKANNGVDGNKYYAALIVPRDFSRDLASLQSTEKVTAHLDYSVNEKRNYIASQILNSAMNKVEKEIRSSMDEEITVALGNKLREVPTQLDRLADGLGTMYSGSRKLVTGAYKLDSGAAALQKGALKVDNGAGDLKTGAVTLYQGTAKVNDGAGKVYAGAADVDKGAEALKSGTAALKDGGRDLDTGLGSIQTGLNLMDKKLPALKSGVQALDAGMNTGDGTAENPGLKAGIQKYTDGVAQAQAGVDSTSAGLNNYYQGLQQLYKSIPEGTALDAAHVAQIKGTLNVILNGDGTTDNPGLGAVNKGLQQADYGLTALKNNSSSLNSGAQQVAEGAATLDSSLPALESGLSSLKTGIDAAKNGSSNLYSGLQSADEGMAKLSTGSSSLKNGSAALYSGTNDLTGGAGKLAAGAGTLKKGTAALSAGAWTLHNGTGTLATGLGTLDSGLKTAGNGIDSSLESTKNQMPALNGMGAAAADPVKIKTDEVDYVPNYGTAFAPYFMSLSLWVGGLIIFFGIYYDLDKRYKYLCRDSANVVIRTFAYLVIGVAQAVILALIVKYALGLHVLHFGGYFMSCILVSVVFVAIIQFFIVHLKDLGKFIVMALLILQLTSCGGTFPMETVPRLFNVLYPFMPMTYSVGLFKETISGATGSSMMMNLTVLFGLLGAFTAATIIMSLMKKGVRDLRKMKRARRLAHSMQA